MLVVRGARLDRDRPRRHRRHHLLERVEPAASLAVEAKSAVLCDRGPQQRIGEDAPRDDSVGDHEPARFRRGGSGTKTETSSW